MRHPVGNIILRHLLALIITALIVLDTIPSLCAISIVVVLNLLIIAKSKKHQCDLVIGANEDVNLQCFDSNDARLPGNELQPIWDAEMYDNTLQSDDITRRYAWRSITATNSYPLPLLKCSHIYVPNHAVLHSLNCKLLILRLFACIRFGDMVGDSPGSWKHFKHARRHHNTPQKLRGDHKFRLPAIGDCAPTVVLQGREDRQFGLQEVDDQDGVLGCDPDDVYHAMTMQRSQWAQRSAVFNWMLYVLGLFYFYEYGWCSRRQSVVIMHVRTEHTIFSRDQLVGLGVVCGFLRQTCSQLELDMLPLELVQFIHKLCSC